MVVGELFKIWRKPCDKSMLHLTEQVVFHFLDAPSTWAHYGYAFELLRLANLDADAKTPQNLMFSSFSRLYRAKQV
jgi:hypothetical protein